MAVRPDGQFVASASRDGTVRLWRLADGKEAATLPMGAAVGALALDPWEAWGVCGDARGSLSAFELVGIDYGPRVVTPVRYDQEAILHCPACDVSAATDPRWLGAEIQCPDRCGARFRLHSCVAEPWPRIDGREYRAAEGSETEDDP